MTADNEPPQVQALLSFLEHDNQPAVVLDTDYRILGANSAFRRHYGARNQVALGETCFRVSHGYDFPCDQVGEDCPMLRTRETLAPDRVLHIHQSPRGPEHVEVELRPILDQDRQIVAYVERLNAVCHVSANPHPDGLVGRSPAFNAAVADVQRVGPSNLPVLLLGESGTGKELFARAVHQASDRSDGPFVVVDCSGLTESLFESELFGYEKGAFTGATARKRGLVETAHGGTLFLDEIGDVPLPLQVKLLRLIETGTYRRLGGLETRQADFRLVAATHQPLARMVAEGRFREDLYYRIAPFPIVLPPLRARREDIGLLVASFLERGRGFKAGLSVSPDALERLCQHDWPGNIRELRNVIERARLFADGGEIRVSDLPPGLGGPPGVGMPFAAIAAPLAARPVDQYFGAPRPTPLSHGGQAARTGAFARLPAPALGEFLAPGQIAPGVGEMAVESSAHAASHPGADSTPADALRRPAGQWTDEAIRHWVAAFQGTRRELAEALGLSERTLYRRLKALGLG